MNILILTGKFGMGHWSASQSLQQQLLHSFPDARVEVEDFLTYAVPKFAESMYKGFNMMVTYGSHLFNIYYKLTAMGHTDARPPFEGLFLDKLTELLQQYQPDAVIATHPLCAQLVSRLKEQARGKGTYGLDLPLITCVTDVSSHPEWINQNTDCYLVASREVRQQLVEKGVDSALICVTGIPVREEFRHLGHCGMKSGEVAEAYAFESTVGGKGEPERVKVKEGFAKVSTTPEGAKIGEGFAKVSTGSEGAKIRESFDKGSIGSKSVKAGEDSSINYYRTDKPVADHYVVERETENLSANHYGMEKETEKLFENHNGMEKETEKLFENHQGMGRKTENFVVNHYGMVSETENLFTREMISTRASGSFSWEAYDRKGAAANKYLLSDSYGTISMEEKSRNFFRAQMADVQEATAIAPWDNGNKKKREVLIMGGGLGLLPKSENFYSSLNEIPDTHITIITGRNEKLLKRLQGRWKNIQVVGYTNQVWEYMSKADLIVTKPGGITLFETIFAQVPILTWPPTLQQEKGNACWLMEEGIGWVAEKKNCAREIQEILMDDERLSRARYRMGQLKEQMRAESLNGLMEVIARSQGAAG